jgi:hypothetical protein
MALEQATKEQLERLMVVVNAIEDVGYEGINNDYDRDMNKDIVHELLDQWMYVGDRSYSSVYKFVTDKYSHSLKDKRASHQKRRVNWST